MPLKDNLSVFIGIPRLAQHDRYEGYLGSILNHIQAQKTDVKILKPYLTPPQSGRFHHGEDDRLEAIAGRMNNIVDKFMATNASHVFFNDGDIEIPPNTVDTLIRHNVDVATGVYPFHNFDSCRAMCFGRMKTDHPCGNMIPRDWDYMTGQVFGENERWTGGTGCLLVKRRVFKQHHPKLPPLRFNRDNDCGMDMLFWKRVQDAGFTARVDANVVCGHRPKYRLSDIDKWLA